VDDGYGAPLGAPAPAGPGLWGRLGPWAHSSPEVTSWRWPQESWLVAFKLGLWPHKNNALKVPSRQGTGIPKRETGRAESTPCS